MSGPIVYLIDDQKAVRDALAEMLNVLGFAVTTYKSADEFLAALEGKGFGCIVADVRMPGTDGIALVRELERRKTGFPVVLISGHADVPMAVAAINRGLARAFSEQTQRQPFDQLSANFARLTSRQSEIFDLVAQGFTSHAIAAKLGISTRTVESYRTQVMEKMQAESVAVLVRQAIRLGRIAP